jgi:hypothetical protein
VLTGTGEVRDENLGFSEILTRVLRGSLIAMHAVVRDLEKLVKLTPLFLREVLLYWEMSRFPWIGSGSRHAFAVD